MPLPSYLAWLDGVRDVLDGAKQAVPTFGRYATPCDVPNDPTPLKVLIDISEVEDPYVAMSTNESIDIEDLFREISK